MTDHELQPCPVCGGICELTAWQNTGCQYVYCLDCRYHGIPPAAHKFICDCVASAKDENLLLYHAVSLLVNVMESEDPSQYENEVHNALNDDFPEIVAKIKSDRAMIAEHMAKEAGDDQA